ncbi:MAG: phage tail tape measure protein, partial [Magnetospirillum sp.]|nr:phage tail tape measure protein [Magnetospirillum sp.]
MADLAAYLGLYVKGDAAHKVDALEKGFERLSTRGAAHMGALSRSMGLAGQGLDKLGNRYTALLSGAAGAGAVKFTGDLQERMNYLGITAGKSAEDMAALKKEVFAAAQMPDIRLDPAQLLDAVDTIVEKTGDLDLARTNLVNMGRAMRATKADGKDMGAWVAQLSEKFNIKTSDGILAAIDHSINAGKAGAMTFKDLSAQGERLTASYAAVGRSGREAGMEQDALIQMIRKGTGSSEQAATAFEALMRTFSDAKKLKELKAVGIKVMDDKGNMRSGVDLYKELITKSKGDAVKLSTIFDSEAMRALNAGIAEFKNTGGLASLDQFMNVASDGATVKADALRANAGNINASVTALATAGKQFADVNLAGPVGDLADAIGKLQPEQVQATMKAIAWGAGALGAAVAVKKGVDAVRWTADTLSYVRGKGGKGGLAGAAAGAAGATAGGGQPIPVIVMNWPGGGMSGAAGGLADLAGDVGGKGGKAAAGKGAKSLIGRVASRGAGLMGGLLRRAGPLAAIGMGAYEGIGAMMAGDTRAALGAAGRAVGGGIGGVAGGAAGTAVLPGVGTAVGGLVGATAGAAGGEALMTKLYDWLSGEKDKKNEPAKMEGQMAI